MMPKAYVEPISIGTQLPDMPLFLEQDWYVNVPLEEMLASIAEYRSLIPNLSYNLSDE
jgi:hypothetical protein